MRASRDIFPERCRPRIASALRVSTENNHPTFEPDPRAFRFCLLWAAILTFFNAIAIHREGIWDQELHWDSGWYIGIAIHLKRALESGGLEGFASEWVNFSKIHAPLVPALSSMLMALFGESRPIACAIFPLSTVALHLGTFRAVERLYDRKTAWATTLLLGTFPVCIVLSRMYLFEYVAAGMFALAAWALVASDRMARWGPMLLFGLLAGAVSVSRMGNPVLLVGPSLAMAIAALRAGGWVVRWSRLAVATMLALGIAATWYWPNRQAILDYLHLVTYGENAQFYAGKEGAFTLGNLGYYLHVNAVEGPGVPLAVISLLAWAACWRARGFKAAMGPIGLLLLGSYAISFVFLLSATQHVGARYFLPTMPVVALAVVRSIQLLPWDAARAILAAGVVCWSLYQLVATTLLFTVEKADRSDSGWIGSFELWRHGSQFISLTDANGLRNPRADFKIRECVQRLREGHLSETAFIYLLTDHPFFSMHPFHLEFKRLGLRWTFGMAPGLRHREGKGFVDQMANELVGADAVVLRSGGPSYLSDGDYSEWFPQMFDPVIRPFRQLGEPIFLGDGSMARIFVRIPPAQWVGAIPEGLDTSASAVFRGPDGTRLNLVGARLESRGAHRMLTTCYRVEGDLRIIPGVFVHFLRGVEGREIAFGTERQSFAASQALGDPTGGILLLQSRLGQMDVESLDGTGYRIHMGLLWPRGSNAPSLRFEVRSERPTDDNGTRVEVLRAAPRDK